MPKFTFECQTDSCNLRFERVLKIGEHVSHECPNCHDQAPRVMEGFSFGFKEAADAKPGNTGVHKDDYPTADQAVGKSADQRWEQHRARDAVKNTVLAHGQTHALTRRTAPDGSYVEYEPLNEAGRQNRRVKVKKAVEALRVAKEARGGR